MSNNRMVGASLEYLARGWSTMPLNGKTPIVKDWAKLGTPDDFRGVNYPEGSNIGIITGIRSGLVVVDIDPKHGGLDSLFELEMEHGEFNGPRVRTGSGGVHFYFKHPGGRVPNSVGKVAPGIDIRGDGGQVVAPPSVHPETGKRYAWEKTGDLPKIPPWLLAKMGVQSAHTQGQVHAKRLGKPASEWVKLIEEGVCEGGRNHSAASLAGYLLRHNLPGDVVNALLTLWNTNSVRPPLDSVELDAVLSSITKRELARND